MKLILILLFLSGCSTIDYSQRVEGWPAMREELHVVSSAEMHAVCDKYGPWFEVTLSCIEVFFYPDVCKIWVTEAGGWLEKHERAHCQGHDHPGGTSMREMVVKHRK